MSEKAKSYAGEVKAALKSQHIRVELDQRDEKIGAKIRHSELNKIPVMLIVGEKEALGGTVSVRRRHQGDLGAMPLTELIEGLKEEIEHRKRSIANS